ncbi:MAG: dephospho-CoA kinase [Gammaproteobacteria bacterium]|jgi:dephospho-CoA kinase|nr:dephospho-CoA kinase [Gammaproteobacteria bacterium]MBT3488682.1 dephospho-CoA kinase [Gammaproteobacteria bacterium]MBT3717436.1 dephospho-CoA kinase [Gammaproteobacteria bacterium]MBT3844215.1 dephospho-CoA kinase [Gammaproteobacteria bacterium]MBT3892084.1 dephospho-CoA kinase [Gammaproteobacteria bacterium]
MIHIGLTGGIACGKSSAAEYFTTLGIPVLDADQAARTAVETGSIGLHKIYKRFGAKVLHEDKTLNRAVLRKIIFTDPAQRHFVEQTLHPIIASILNEQAKQLDASYLIYMIPLLLEKNGRYPIDRILLIDLPQPLQLERLMERDHLSPEEAEAIIAAQPSRESRIALADDTILNLAPSDLQQGIAQLHQQYLQLSQSE